LCETNAPATPSTDPLENLLHAGLLSETAKFQGEILLEGLAACLRSVLKCGVDTVW